MSELDRIASKSFQNREENAFRDTYLRDVLFLS